MMIRSNNFVFLFHLPLLEPKEIQKRNERGKRWYSLVPAPSRRSERTRKTWSSSAPTSFASLLGQSCVRAGSSDTVCSSPRAQFNTAMWRVQDAIRQARRLSHLEHIDSMHASLLQREREPFLRPCPNSGKYLTVGGLSGRMMLVSWLFSESANLNLSLSTPCLSVSYLERLLGRVHVPLCSAQDHAATCLLIAIKMEEVGGDAMEKPDDMEIRVCLKREVFVLETLEWNLVAPTSYTFLCVYGESVWLPHPGRQCACNYLKHMLMCKRTPSSSPVAGQIVQILFCTILWKKCSNYRRPREQISYSEHS